MSLANLILSRLPYRPYCSNNLAHGLRIRPATDAQHYAYLQLNPHVLKHWLVFDIDRSYGGFAWEQASLPPPNWFATNPANGHAHLAYLLETPVVTSDNGRKSALRYAAAVEAVFALALRSDPGYSGLIVKNPLHSAWKTLLLHEQAYSLGELSQWVILPKVDNTDRQVLPTGLGRNVTLFEELRKWAYAWVRTYIKSASYEQWLAAVLREATIINGRFSTPLPNAEIRATTKSVAGWTWRKFSEEQFSAIQRARGKKSGEARRKDSAAETKPWEAEGVSRSTYYARRSQLDSNHIR